MSTQRYVNGLKKVYLMPSEVYIGEEPTAVTTVLGSCVSLTLFHPRLNIGSICHGVMPVCSKTGKCEKTCVECFKYVDCAIMHMVRKFETYGIRRAELDVKFFGGADMLGSKASKSIGLANVKSALEVIHREKLKLVAQDVGDSFGRKIIFHTHTGDVFVNRFDDRRKGPRPGKAFAASFPTMYKKGA